MEGTAEEGRLEGALEGWVGPSSTEHSGVSRAKGVSCSPVQGPESSGHERGSQRPRDLGGVQSSLGFVQRGQTWSKLSSICWEPTLCRF